MEHSGTFMSMTAEILEEEKKELQESLNTWRKKLEEARLLAAQAERQIDIHGGHLERIELWIKKLTQ
jgi:prephenate dehydrogenase